MTRDQQFFRLEVDQRTREILRQHSGPGIMTMLEAANIARDEIEAEYTEYQKREIDEIRASFERKRRGEK